MNNLLWLAGGFMLANFLSNQKMKSRIPPGRDPGVKDPEAPGTEGGTVQGMGGALDNPIINDAFNFQQDHFQTLSS